MSTTTNTAADAWPSETSTQVDTPHVTDVADNGTEIKWALKTQEEADQEYLGRLGEH